MTTTTKKHALQLQFYLPDGNAQYCTQHTGRAGLVASEAGHHGHVQLLPGGGARQESQAEQAHPPQPQGHPLQGGRFFFKSLPHGYWLGFLLWSAFFSTLLQV